MKNFSLHPTVLLMVLVTSIAPCKKEDIVLSEAAMSSVRNAIPVEPMVMTPYGKVPASRVHEVDNKTIVKVVGGHLQMLNKQTGHLIKDIGLSKGNAASSGLQSLGFKWNGSTAMGKSANASSENTASAASGTSYPGYATYNDDITNIQSFSTTWTVPQLPLDTSFSVTYLWNGLAGGRLQPVMEYYGGSTYYIANWYTTDNDADILHGATIPVPVGTKLTGVISFVSHNDSEWTYQQSFVGYPEADVTVVRNSEANGVIEAWEAYTPLLSQWPNQPVMAMKDIRLTSRIETTPSTINWYPYGGPFNSPSGENTVVVCNSSTNGEVDFYFGDGTGISPDSSYNVVSALDGSLLDEAFGLSTNGTPVVVRSSNDANSQKWKLVSLHNGYYTLLSGNAPSKALTVKNESTTTGAVPKIYPNNGTMGQQWKITPVGNGYCTLSPAGASSLSLRVVKGTKLLQLSTMSNTDAEKFQFVLP